MNHQYVWMKSKTHIKYLNLFWWTLFMNIKISSLKLKIKTIFSKIKTIIIKTHKFFFCVCVCVYELEQSTTNLSFTFYLKTNLSTYKHNTSLHENLLLKIFFSILTWSKPWFMSYTPLWVLDAIFEERALESTRASVKIWLQIFYWS